MITQVHIKTKLYSLHDMGEHRRKNEKKTGKIDPMVFSGKRFEYSSIKSLIHDFDKKSVRFLRSFALSSSFFFCSFESFSFSFNWWATWIWVFPGGDTFQSHSSCLICFLSLRQVFLGLILYLRIWFALVVYTLYISIFREQRNIILR